MFGGREPRILKYGPNVNNNIKSAKFVKWMYFLKQNKDKEEELNDFEEALEKWVNSYWANKL